ncbi:hypothetical protein KMAL_30870 [Novacetimonas maltaceti]|uniref:Uncharacterized protein n=1 Tax=Novacetimonas maltaceti TaxID=1203393 RepID=A0A2S3VXI1_9PROT|nr:hypothetical protein KMAL_30870 [Novacetimonas maltaceti]
MSHTSVPRWVQSNIPSSPDDRVGVVHCTCAVQGVAAPVGMSRMASRTNSGSSITAQAIDRALMPASNTPWPPGFQNQLAPGCHFCTLSRHVMRIARMPLAESSWRAGAMAGAQVACHDVISVRRALRARRCRSIACDRMGVGGFSSSTCHPAASACAASA